MNYAFIPSHKVISNAVLGCLVQICNKARQYDKHHSDSRLLHGRLVSLAVLSRVLSFRGLYLNLIISTYCSAR